MLMGKVDPSFKIDGHINNKNNPHEVSYANLLGENSSYTKLEADGKFIKNLGVLNDDTTIMNLTEAGVYYFTAGASWNYSADLKTLYVDTGSTYRIYIVVDSGNVIIYINDIDGNSMYYEDGYGWGWGAFVFSH